MIYIIKGYYFKNEITYKYNKLKYCLYYKYNMIKK